MIEFKTALLFSTVLLSIVVGTNSFGQSSQSDRNPYHLKLIQTATNYQNQVFENPEMEMVELKNSIPDIKLDIRYATANNFTGKVIYGSPRAFARKPVVEALRKIQDSLSIYNLGLKIYDSYRPYSATLRFFEVYPDTNFVASPRSGSRHNRGCAVDLTLIDKNTGEEIPMPTAFDDFSERAHPEYPNLPEKVLANRKFLFGLFTHFGFNHYPSEWWHFDFNGWDKYPLMDLSFEELSKNQYLSSIKTL